MSDYYIAFHVWVPSSRYPHTSSSNQRHIYYLVTWVEDYIKLVHNTSEASKILADIDRRYVRICVSCLYTIHICHILELRLHLHSLDCDYFLRGRGFKQWTGDDSQALMKVHIFDVPISTCFWLIVIGVPTHYCRLCSTENAESYQQFYGILLPNSLISSGWWWLGCKKIHQEHTIFESEGVRPDGFSLLCQHSLGHDRLLIMEFRVPNGLCL